MLQTDIKREPVYCIAEFDETSINIGDEAREVLGYSTLADTTANLDPTGDKPIAKALQALGIEVLNLSDVQTYQLEHLREVAQRMFDEWLQKDARDINTLRNSWNNFRGPAWEKTGIEKYKEPVPEFVLNKAIQIKKAYPDCQILIEHLNESPDPFLIIQTPIAASEWKDPAERYYVEVWNEPKFEGRVR